MSSNTADEYESPGGGPADPRNDVAQHDSAMLSSGRQGAAGEGAAAGDASDAAAADSNGTQDEPAMDTHETTDQAKIDGIVAQTRADFPSGSDAEGMEHALRQRFSDVGIAVDDDQIRRLAGG